MQPGPHPQDAHAQGPEAVISQPELHADSGVNLNQTLPHGSPGKPMPLPWEPAGQGGTEGRTETPPGQEMGADLSPWQPLRGASRAGGRSAP